MGDKLSDSHVYKTANGRQLAVAISYPDDWKPDDRRPAIVFFFGGAWEGGTTAQFLPQAKYFAQRGLVCARVDYRVRSRDGVSPDKCVEDALSSMRWVRKNARALGVDPSRIVSAGGSAGGHLAACAFFTEGLGDSNDDLTISPKPNAMILYNPALEVMREDHPGLSEDVIEKISPIRHLTKELVPTLIVDGTKDFFYDRIRDFVHRADELGAPVEAYWVEGQEHGFFNHTPWLATTTQRVDEFLQSMGYLAADPEAPLPSERADFGEEKSGERPVKNT